MSCQASRREDFFRSVHLERPAKTPFYFTLCDSLIEEFERRHGKQNYFDFFDMPFRALSLKPTRNPPDYSRYFEDLQVVDEINEWGVGYIRGSRYHFRRMVSPMKNFEDPSQVWRFPLPDILYDYRWEGFAERIGELKSKDYVIMNAPPFIDIFEPAWYLRGFEQLLMDLHLNPPMAEACLDLVASLSRCSRALLYRWSRWDRTSSGASGGRPLISMRMTFLSGNSSPISRRSALSLLTITASREA